MLETESILTALEQDRILGMTNLGLPADQPLPEPVDPPPLAVPEPDAKVKVEPIALHVPAECFYVRFGSFSNFLWMQDTLDTLGRRPAKPGGPAGLGLRPRRAHAGPAHPAADRAFAAAGRHGDFRRGHNRHATCFSAKGRPTDSSSRRETTSCFRLRHRSRSGATGWPAAASRSRSSSSRAARSR